LLRQACESLDDAHRSGLVHRDVKPANLFVGRKARHHDFVHVLDFGLVKHRRGVHDDRDVTLTAHDSFQGTPAFAAPEAVTGDEVTERADLYALGCVGYWLVTGRLVFDADTVMKVAIAHAKEEPSPPSVVAEQAINPAFERLIMQCLRKEPASRPQTAHALREALDACEGLGAWTEEDAETWWRLNRPEQQRPTRT
jgi:serine/threonine-protein kinase